jgi:NitT/TauT family transport system permease protein
MTTSPRNSPSLAALLAIPAAALVALGVHLAVGGKQPEAETLIYIQFLATLLILGTVVALAQRVWAPLSRWLSHSGPIIAAGILVLCLWDIITTGLHWLPMPYFPGPAAVSLCLVLDRQLLFDSTWHSLFLLLAGYAIGVVLGLITGVCIGWFAKGRYWGMPLLKVIGPIPATAWIPLAMVLSPSPMLSGIGLIALAVWFPVTMLTASGVSNTRASYLDVARTLGASRAYLIFRVAIPAASPNIFVGLFMGLGASFLTLVVAETVGVKSGLGWYLGWAQCWAEYAKVYGALVIMSAFFSTIMTLLFKLRDRVLLWQKGTIRW